MKTLRLAALGAALGISLLSSCSDDSSGSDTGTDPGTTDCSSATGGAQVVCLANAFSATLSSSQQSTVQLDLNATNAARWSNLPVELVPRNGIALGDLNETQLAAALALAQAGLSAAGYSTFQSIRAADTYLSQYASGYGEGLYYIAFLGAPSTTSPWILQMGGHHYAVNVTYNGGSLVNVTPNFVGVEPQTFSLNGTTYTPLSPRRAAMYSMINSLDATQRTAAQLASSFDDVLVGPGKDGAFPAQEGVIVSTLTADQQALVKAAIEQWVKDAPDSLANAFLADYESDASLAQTRVAWATSTDSTVVGSYLPIHGPRVWIEFACQGGIVFRDQIHFHTIWRDKEEDYGAVLGG